MVTTVGTGSDLRTIIQNFIILEHDAIAAYTATIERLEDSAHKAKITEFRADHERHVRELTELASRHGAPVPTEGDMKQMLTTGKVKIAAMMGDAAILKAMSSNENDTISAYESGAANNAIPAGDRPMFERAAADERRHKSYMDSAAR